ncbi:uncharacterized protein L969DRAFT_74510 [Mixia osmundae IAM 14324]|uniref:Phospholipid/glycerol acyltransferase domain-containing protein n=1 Tax=Mixia osmundae (strain CBS 9802 / IAM 14324 / JCM 22182 / KY 12970) TaxID=764103 RepID=G7E3J7_MIXOS|nr:uncharacterized protein L969DRAFT_74510 [Mixia osmundae IAM 14324]KEI39392.1 hypothetical protein L969DRAFT_74510 [Mixia osmundae IAM 14324]GAA97407.1 hypothetical protein E5Q_04085 [Mixia osmundae IAM 14324]
MERLSKWRDAGTGIAPFVGALAPGSDDAQASVLLRPLLLGCAAIKCALLLGMLVQYALLVELPLLVFADLGVWQTWHTRVRARDALFLMGFLRLGSEVVSLQRRQGRHWSSKRPGPADLIAYNASSLVDLLWLAAAFAPSYVVPVVSTPASGNQSKVLGFQRTTLLGALWRTSSVPTRTPSSPLLDLTSCQTSARRALSFSPEATTSNNRCLLRFPDFTDVRAKPKTVTHIIAFKHDAPSRYSPTVTLPVKLEAYQTVSLAKSVFQICLAPLPWRQVSVRRLASDESIDLSAARWEELADRLSTLAKLKRVGISVRDKQGFVEYASKAKR